MFSYKLLHIISTVKHLFLIQFVRYNIYAYKDVGNSYKSPQRKFFELQVFDVLIEL